MVTDIRWGILRWTILRFSDRSYIWYPVKVTNTRFSRHYYQQIKNIKIIYWTKSTLFIKFRFGLFWFPVKKTLVDQQGVIMIKYFLVASNLFALLVSVIKITYYWHTILIPKHFTLVSPNGPWCLLGLTPPLHFKNVSLQNSQCWYLNNPGSTIYLVAWSCFSKLVQNLESRSNRKSQWQYLNGDNQIEVGWFERRINYRKSNN